MEEIDRFNDMSDIEIAVSLVQHLENPCKDGYGNTLLPMWINIAKQMARTFENPYATELVLTKIREYT